MQTNNEQEAKWREYHEENPHVYELIEKFAYQVMDAGYQKYGMKALLERVRWHTMMTALEMLMVSRLTTIMRHIMPVSFTRETLSIKVFTYTNGRSCCMSQLDF